MSSMMALLAGFGSGYLKGQQQKLENERQAKKDEQDQKLFDIRMEEAVAARDERQRERDYRDANAAALSAGKQDTGYQVTDAAGSNAFTKDADAAGVMADMAATKNDGVQNNAATRVSTGRSGATMNGTVAGNKVFADPAQAQQFAGTQTMSDYAKLKARQDVADQFGKMDISDDIRAKLLKLESEGAFKAYSLAQSGDYDGAAKVYQETGQNRLPEGAKFVGNEVEDPTTKIKRNVISLMGKDGKPIIADVDQALRTYLTPSERYTLESNDRKTAVAEQAVAVKEKADENRYLSTMAAIAARNGAGASNGMANGPSLKDRRDYLSDFSLSLPDPKAAATPEEAQAISAGNQRVLAQADAVFSINAELGNILTAPQAAAAMRLAQDPANIRRVRDNNTGIVYEMVQVNGKPVVVAAGKMKPKEKEKPSAPSVATTPNPKATMSDTVAKTYPHAGYETVQGAIDGAKRGDKNAIAYVKMIQDSGLPIQQREQIKNILSGK